MKKSMFGRLNSNDLLKGLLVAVLTAFITGLCNAIEMGIIEFAWVFYKPMVMTSVGSGLAYILKNWLTNSKDKFLTAE